MLLHANQMYKMTSTSHKTVKVDILSENSRIMYDQVNEYLFTRSQHVTPINKHTLSWLKLK